MKNPGEAKWWQKTTVYQVYPRSFADGNGDGVGDIPGIIGKLDYLQDLGFETIWFSPIYDSPQADHGYDIRDYCAISSDFGVLADADRLIAEIHKRGMRVAFDMVMNHTSIEHPWFVESRSSRTNPKRGWYIWRDGRGGKPPNNWSSFVSQKGWQYDETTGQWYSASFFPFQPDLNYDNPDVKRAMFDVLRFWLDRGIDGFRLDIFHAIYKDDQFRDNPFRAKYFIDEVDHDGYFQRKIRNVNHPKNFQLAKDLRAVLDEYQGDRFAVGEVAGEHSTIKKYLGDEHDGLNLIFLFQTLRVRFHAGSFRDLVRDIESHYPYPYCPTYVFGNHDQRRVMRRLGNDPRKVKLLALFQFTARGVPVTYYGEELAMRNASFGLAEASDPMAKMYKWIPQWFADLVGLSDLIVRERARTPMQWDGTANAGFCPPEVRPWVPVNGDYREVNVTAETADPASVLNTYKRLLRVRKGSRALQEGSMQLLEGADIPTDLLAYTREYGDARVLVLINFGARECSFRNRTGCTEVSFVTDAQPADGPASAAEQVTVPAFSGTILRNARSGVAQ